MSANLEGNTILIGGWFLDDPFVGENYFGALYDDVFVELGGQAGNKWIVLKPDPTIPVDELEFKTDIKLPDQGSFLDPEFRTLPVDIDFDANTYSIRVNEDWSPYFESHVMRFRVLGAETIIGNKLLQVDYASPIPFEPVDPKLYYTENPSFNTFAVNFGSAQGTIKEGTVYKFGLDFQLPLTDTPPTDPATPPDEISANWIDPVTGQNLNDNLANGSLAEGMYRGRRDQFGLARNFSSDDEITLNVKNSENSTNV